MKKQSDLHKKGFVFIKILTSDSANFRKVCKIWVNILTLHD